MDHVTVIGGGLAGSEAAWQLAERGIQVNLYEMRPKKTTGAHVSDWLGELVCSNSLGSKLRDRATGLLQHELRLLQSKLMACAAEAAVPAGDALAVDRVVFAKVITNTLSNHPNITIIRKEVTDIPDGYTIIATGPLTSPTLAEKIANLTGHDYLYFYDAVSPIVSIDNINMSVAFYGNRYNRGESDEGDYINCPLDEPQYKRFVDALRSAETVELHDFEREDPNFFEGCVPIEVLAKRGDDTLAYGPMRPVGLTNPNTGKRPYAVVQLRRDNLAGDLYNLVGFQTNMRYGQQTDVLRLIPGLEKAEFVRLGQMHRNTFINSPMVLEPTMRFKQRPSLYFAGQITGVEGYVGNVATGLVAGVNLARQIKRLSEWIVPATTMLGGLCYYVTHAEVKHFQPMKANFGILPQLESRIKNKRRRYLAYADRALDDLATSISQLDDKMMLVSES